METEIMINADNEDDVKRIAVELPKLCPQCGLTMKPIHLYSFTPNEHSVFSCFLCPACENAFLIQYQLNYDHCYTPLPVFPKYGEKEQFPANIQDVSPMFCRIYNESLDAENRGLTNICGMGYRKALEFLIKDYAIQCYPDAIEEIQRIELGRCILTYIDSEKIKTLARASAWLGNDETHYVRKHEDYNVQHLKAFILAAMNYINYELEVTHASALLNPNTQNHH